MDTTTHLIIDAFAIIVGGLAGGLLAWLFDRSRAKFYRDRDAIYARYRRERKAERAQLDQGWLLLAQKEHALGELARETHIISHTAVEMADTDPNVRLQRMVEDWRMPEPGGNDDDTVLMEAQR